MADDTTDNGSLFARWSKRRQAVAEHEAAGRDADAIAAATAPDIDGQVPAETGETDDEVLERLGLPDPDTLEKGDDFSAFMGSAIPARLRNRALRRLWLTNPVLANLDELVDYGEDFTDAATVIENLQTAYQVGRGFLTEEEDTDTEESDDTPAKVDPESIAQPQAEIGATSDSARPGEQSTDILTASGTDNGQPAGAVESAGAAMPLSTNSDGFAETDEDSAKISAKPKPRMRFRFDSV